MDRPFLLLARNWHRHGGMQRLSRDLWDQLQRYAGDRTRLCIPSSRSPFALASFVIRAIREGRRTLKRGGRVHMMDASLCILFPFFRDHLDRVTVTAHGLDVSWAHPFYQWMIRRFLPRAKLIHCVSRATANAVIARGVDPGRIVILPCGIGDVSVSSGSAGDIPRLVTVGRLVERKGVVWFLAEVLPLLIALRGDIKYHIVGTGPAEQSIKKVIREKSLQEAVFLHGELDDATRDALVEQSNVFLMPNVPVPGDMEGFGIACIEASARGIPIVAANSEGLRDAVIEGETGTLFHPGDATDCCNAIIGMLSSQPDHAAIARATRARFHWSMLFPRYVNAIFES